MLNILIPDLDADIRPVVRTIRSVRRKNIKLWLSRQTILKENALKDAKDVKPVEEGINPDFSLRCLLWDIDNTRTSDVENAIFRYCIERNKQNPSDFWIVLTSSSYPKNQVCLFLDNLQDVRYPDKWYKYECVTDENGVNDFCDTHDFVLFSLCKNDRFEIANDNFKHIRGAKVFREKSTGYYWYLDTFHRNHIEVFDSFGKKHLGEADLKTGVFDPNKADNSKLPIL